MQDPIKPLNCNGIFIKNPMGLDHNYLAPGLSLSIVFIAFTNKP